MKNEIAVVHILVLSFAEYETLRPDMHITFSAIQRFHSIVFKKRQQCSIGSFRNPPHCYLLLNP
jgi:hypothetical protein